jgi:hypothetical protein
MSVAQISAQDLTAFVAALRARTDLSVTLDPIEVVEIQACVNPSSDRPLVYLWGRDRLYAIASFPVFEAGVHLTHGIACLDPLFVSAAPPQSNLWVDDAANNGGKECTILVPGQPHLETGQQALYTSAGGEELRRVNPDTCVAERGTAFGQFIPIGIFAGEVSDPGYWEAIAPGLIFEGLTEGIEGETLLSGPDSYPAGLYLVAAVHWGLLADENFTEPALIWVDVASGRLVGFLGAQPDLDVPPTAFPAEASTQLHRFSEAPIAGDEFRWLPAQFLPDPDSQWLRPKGQLLLHSQEMLPVVSGTPDPGDEQRIYLRLVDFNPRALSAAVGTPVREHGRITLTTRMHVGMNPQLGIPGQAVWKGDNPESFQCVALDPIRARFVVLLWADDEHEPGTGQISSAGAFALAPIATQIGPPEALSVPRSGDLLELVAQVRGDLDEPAPGALVSWTLRRSSTLDEELSVTGGIGTTSAVDHPPIDAGSLTIDADVGGTLTALDEGVDYTVNLATGIVTWASDQSGADAVLASYRHRGTPATPGHGTLLAAQTSSDAQGIARTFVDYVDGPVAGLDRIDAELA